MENNTFENDFTSLSFYHVYPLGLYGAKERNDFSSPKGDFFEKYAENLPKIREQGANALYIGPLFESTAHGYDTVDYFYVDRRLGNNESFKIFVQKAHENGIKVIVDAVFNHTGRDFFAFKDLKEKKWNSQYKDWYKNVDFSRNSPYNDGFDYEGWAGCKDLVKLNTENPQVKEHIFSAVKSWVDNFDIDGLRLDAADVLPLNFLRELSDYSKSLKNGFFLMGEVVHGDYSRWVREGKLDSVTNYEAYKGLWSSFNSRNMFEIAYSLKREFSDGGIYRNIPLYNFLDNHDVDRIASTVTKDEYLFPLYGLLYTMPGVPSIYYGSEDGIKGKRSNHSDKALRPSLPPFAPVKDENKPSPGSGNLQAEIKRFSSIRKSSNALKKGNYRELSVSNTSLAFIREFYGEKCAVFVNAEDKESFINLHSPLNGRWYDVLSGEHFENPRNVNVPKTWLRILKAC